MLGKRLGLWRRAKVRRHVRLQGAFEEVAYGHSAKRVVHLLEIWDANRAMTARNFGKPLAGTSFAFHSVSVPVTFIEGKAYVGGMSLDRKEREIRGSSWRWNSQQRHYRRNQNAWHQTSRAKVSIHLCAVARHFRCRDPGRRLQSVVARELETLNKSAARPCRRWSPVVSLSLVSISENWIRIKVESFEFFSRERPEWRSSP